VPASTATGTFSSGNAKVPFLDNEKLETLYPLCFKNITVFKRIKDVFFLLLTFQKNSDVLASKTSLI
jgi:hypothetical protein